MRFVATAVAALLVFAGSCEAGAGFRQMDVPDPPGRPLTIGIWFPSSGQTSSQPVGPFQQNVALNASIIGMKLPVVFISHGTAGSLGSHYDTALGLAEAGFVVVALTHTGDNYQDQTYAGNRIDLTDRPRQLKQVIRFVLEEWSERIHIDAARVGVFGFSLGGFTALVEGGGVPDLRRMKQLCDERPTAPECSFIEQRQGPVGTNQGSSCVGTRFSNSSRSDRSSSRFISLWVRWSEAGNHSHPTMAPPWTGKLRTRGTRLW